MVSDQIEKDFRALGKKHSTMILEQFSENDLKSSSEIVVQSGIQPTQVYRVLSELEKVDFVEREETLGNVKEPHVFWKLTRRGRAAKRLVQDYKEKAIRIKG